MTRLATRSHLQLRVVPDFKNFFLVVFGNRAYHELERPLGDSPIS